MITMMSSEETVEGRLRETVSLVAVDVYIPALDAVWKQVKAIREMASLLAETPDAEVTMSAEDQSTEESHRLVLSIHMTGCPDHVKDLVVRMLSAADDLGTALEYLWQEIDTINGRLGRLEKGES